MFTFQGNKKTAYYAIPNSSGGVTEKVDKYGYRTGENVKTYEAPVKTLMSFSAKGGDATYEPFGLDLNYKYTCILEKGQPELPEGTKIL